METSRFSTPATLTVPASQTAPSSQVRTLERGWALRGAMGSTYGARYMTGEFRQEIIQLFRDGEAHKGSKASPGIMHEHLVRKHPEKMIPSVLEIASLISSMAQMKSSGQTLETLVYTKNTITVEVIPEMANKGEQYLKKASVKVLREFLSSKGQPVDGLKAVLLERALAVCEVQV
ncbi:hypothetical protein RI054_16g74930 [Pseudoscourfieldia marina]